jgi:hypothetical protein
MIRPSMVDLTGKKDMAPIVLDIRCQLRVDSVANPRRGCIGRVPEPDRERNSRRYRRRRRGLALRVNFRRFGRQLKLAEIRKRGAVVDLVSVGIGELRDALGGQQETFAVWTDDIRFAMYLYSQSTVQPMGVEVGRTASRLLAKRFRVLKMIQQIKRRIYCFMERTRECLCQFLGWGDDPYEGI